MNVLLEIGKLAVIPIHDCLKNLSVEVFSDCTPPPNNGGSARVFFRQFYTSIRNARVSVKYANRSERLMGRIVQNEAVIFNLLCWAMHRGKGGVVNRISGLTEGRGRTVLVPMNWHSEA